MNKDEKIKLEIPKLLETQHVRDSRDRLLHANSYYEWVKRKPKGPWAKFRKVLERGRN